jgi:hypothetical protein
MIEWLNQIEPPALIVILAGLGVGGWLLSIPLKGIFLPHEKDE